ncbi:Protein CER1-like 1 [Platanthera guangdongensis]|uniref:Protein CER1-like 1 n=1 Tax=Platanthera guangdongensis TaxID=2320717 RepID=A0ABR2N1K6_9ASPA
MRVVTVGGVVVVRAWCWRRAHGIRLRQGFSPTVAAAILPISSQQQATHDPALPTPNMLIPVTLQELPPPEQPPSARGSPDLFATATTYFVWLVGDCMEDAGQRKAPKGTIFIPFSCFPPKKVRKDCQYYSTPAMRIPNELQNLHSCEVIKSLRTT